MADQFLGEIRVFAHGKAPKDWLPCDGRLITITKETTPLFSVISNRFGGDGSKNFALPNLNGRTPVGAGGGGGTSTRRLGETLGAENVLAGVEHYPPHRHVMCVSGHDGGQTTADRANLAVAVKTSGVRLKPVNVYAEPGGGLASFNEKAVSERDFTNSAHENMQPYLALCFCIAVSGVFPPRPPE